MNKINNSIKPVHISFCSTYVTDGNGNDDYDDETILNLKHVKIKLRPACLIYLGLCIKHSFGSKNKILILEIDF